MKIDFENIQSKAACRNKATEMFFVDEGPISDAKIRIAIGKAVTVCNGCEIQVECLMNAVNNGEEFGIWGGFTARERRKVIGDSIDYEKALEVVKWKRSM